MAFTLKLVQGGSTLVNLIDGTNFISSHWQPGLEAIDGPLVQDKWEGDVLGSSNDTVAQNFQLLNRTLLEAEKNYKRMKRGLPYTPIFLQLQLPTGSYLVQSEVFGSSIKNADDFLETPILGHVIENLRVEFKRRAYFEETGLTQVLTAQNASNNLAQLSISAQRGDLPSPLVVQVTPGTDNIENQVIAALLSEGTLANHLFRLEAEAGTFTGYNTAHGSGVASVADAQMSNGNGAEVTPSSTTENYRIRWTLDGSNGKLVTDQIHRYRVFVRCEEDTGAGSGYKFRVRMGIEAGGERRFGPWGHGEIQLVTVAGTYGVSLPLIDAGILALPALGGMSSVNFNVCIELHGQAASASGPKFRVDCIYLLPLFEGGEVGPLQTGFCVATMPFNLTSTLKLGVISGDDRVPNAYLASPTDGSLTFQRASIQGSPLFLNPNKAHKLYVMTRLADGAQTHKQNQTHTIDAWVRPRYRIVRGV